MESSRERSGRKTILLVEDEAIVALAGVISLKRFGYEAVSAKSGETAVGLAIADRSIDLVLLDIDLGAGIDGTEAARRILAERELPIIFLTAHAEREMVAKVRNLTRYGYVMKDSGDFVLQSSIEMAFELFESLEKARYQSRLYSTLSKINRTIIRVKSQSELFEEVCGIIVDAGKFRSAWIGLLDEECGGIRLISSSEESGTDLSGQDGIDEELSRAGSVIGASMRAGKVILYASPAARGEADAGDDRLPYAAIPLNPWASMVGILNIHATETGFFTREERGLLEEIGSDISFALEKMELEKELESSSCPG